MAGGHPELDGLRELVGLEDDAGRPLTVTVDRPLHAAGQRLMDFLGVTVVVRPVKAISANELLRSEDCTVPGCPREAERDGFCGAHLCAKPTEKPATVGWSRKKIGPETAIEALRAAAAELGRVPTGEEWRKAKRRPSANTIYRIFGTWDAACAAVALPDSASGRSAVVYPDVTGSADTRPGEGDRQTVASAPSPLPVQRDRPEDLELRQIVYRLRWAAGGEFGVLVSPADAARLLWELSA